MKILSINKGFVTNSSSANYWLDDGNLEPEEVSAIINTANNNPVGEKNILNPNADRRSNQEIRESLEEPIVDFSIWLFFSVIMALLLASKKLYKHASTETTKK